MKEGRKERIYICVCFTFNNTRLLVNSWKTKTARKRKNSIPFNRDGDITRQGLTAIMKKSGGNAITRVINDKRRLSSATSYSYRARRLRPAWPWPACI